MKKAIPCNETRFTKGSERDRITFRFVTDDGNTPSACTVRIGDTDPMTGEAVTDMDFFREYYRQVDHEVYRNLRNLRPEYTKEQKARREAEAGAYARGFEEAWGYSPSPDDVRWHLEQLELERYVLYLDGVTDGDGGAADEFFSECGQETADPFGADLPDEILALRGIRDALTGRLRAVYDAML